ncbi:MAG: VanZ family protein [Rhodothermaceae bacterium]|nr:VanZ family protein [Rhodothermaceae bacterium]
MIIRLLLVAFSIFIVWLIYLTNTGQSSDILLVVQYVPYGDKAGHVFLAGILALLVNLALKFRMIGSGRLKLPLGTIITSVIVVLEEWSQRYIPSRTFSGWDLFSDFLGITIFTMLAYLIHRYVQKK